MPLKMGKRDSFLLADDISLLLGSQSSLDGGEDVALRFHSLLSSNLVCTSASWSSPSIHPVLGLGRHICKILCGPADESQLAEERFEVSGDEMERHLSLSLGEPEQLRRNMTPASEANLYVGDGTPGSYGGDEQMDAPPDDMIPQLDSLARPLSVQVHSSCTGRLVTISVPLWGEGKGVHEKACRGQCKQLTKTDRALGLDAGRRYAC